MNGERNLQVLLKSMEPVLHPGEYVFCTLKDNTTLNLSEVVGTFVEQEGLTVILSREKADMHGWAYQFVASWITLTVHSALDAVGLTAAFSTALAKANMSCNVVAGVHHDHIFVDANDAARAVDVLRMLASGGTN
jgi:uncharacterized protein